MGLFAYLAQNFVHRLHSDIKDFRNDLGRLDGRLASLQTEIHRNTTELAVTRQETKALWRAVDGAYQRASDNGITCED